MSQGITARVLRQIDVEEVARPLRIAFGVLEQLHVHLELAGKRNHIYHRLDDVDIAALQRAANERDIRISLGFAPPASRNRPSGPRVS